MISKSTVIDQQEGSLLVSTVGYLVLSAMLTPWLLLPIVINVFALVDMRRMLNKGVSK